MHERNDTQVRAKAPTRRGKVHRMSDEEVAANASIMFDAGFETTSTFLAFLFHVLVNRQDVQNDVRREVMELKDQNGQLDYNTAHSLPYLDSVMNETLRLYSPVTTFVTRQSTVDYKYKDLTIPANVAVAVAVDYMHHDADLWESPNIFDPLRFLWREQGACTVFCFSGFRCRPPQLSGNENRTHGSEADRRSHPVRV